MPRKEKTASVSISKEQKKVLEMIAQLKSIPFDFLINGMIEAYISEHIPLIVDELERIKNSDGGAW